MHPRMGKYLEYLVFHVQYLKNSTRVVLKQLPAVVALMCVLSYANILLSH